MFYVPQLHYCDQLTEKKPIRPDLRQELPDYLFVEKARPEVVVVPAGYLGMAMEHLKQTFGPGKYRVCKALHEYFTNYTGKPEIPMHWFWMPKAEWKMQPGAIVLVAAGSEAEKSAALASDAFDREHGAYALWAVAGPGGRRAASWMPWSNIAKRPCGFARACSAAHVSLGVVCEDRESGPRKPCGTTARRSQPTRTTRLRTSTWRICFWRRTRTTRPSSIICKALAAKPDYAQAHFNLGVMLFRQGRTAEAREHLTAAQQAAAPGTRLADEARRLLQQMPK